MRAFDVWIAAQDMEFDLLQEKNVMASEMVIRWKHVNLF